MSIKENYENFYEEANLNNLLHNISAVWTLKDIPYLFGSSTCNNSSDNMFLDNDNSTSKLTTNRHDSDESEDLYHKPAQVSNFFQNSLPVEQHVLIETHKSTAVSIAQPRELNNQVSTLSDLRNIFGGDITESKNTENLSVLNQILDSQNEDEHANSELLQSGKNKSSLKIHFANSEKDKKTNFSAKQEHSSENRISKNNYTSFDFERCDIDILEELGITREKESEDLQADLPNASRELDLIQDKVPENTQTTPPITHGECSKSLQDKSITVDNLFPPKRSIADQLKSFAFSKSHYSSHQNLESGKSVSNLHENNNKAGPSGLLNIDNKSEKLKNIIHNRKSETASQFVNKKSAFKMIVDRYKSSQTNITEKKDGNYSSTSEISQNSQNINTLNCLPNDKKLNEVTENKTEPINVIENQSPSLQENHSSKKQIPDNNLKKFLFSKKKTPKS